MTAAVATRGVRVPAQAGPPAIEQRPPRSWDLVTAAQAGDRNAFAQLYTAHREHVHKFIYRRTGNHHLAEDLTSEVFVRALRRIGSVAWQGSDIGAWLSTIARNLVVDHFKSKRYQLETSIPDVRDSGDRADQSPEGDPARLAVQHLIGAELFAAVDQLTAEQAECIRLRFIDGLSVLETAAAMGKQEGAVKALQYRAVRTLAAILPPSIGPTR